MPMPMPMLKRRSHDEKIYKRAADRDQKRDDDSDRD
jgi:hypothetical protein